MWFKVAETSVEPRNHHQCVVIGKRQMLAVGGINTYLNDKDRTPQGLSIFDMTDLKWKSDGYYNASAEEYRTPKVVQDWYKGRNLSELDWTSNEVKNMFLAQPAVSSDGQTSSSFSPPTSASTNNVSSTSNNSSTGNVGAITGDVSGSVVVLAIIAGLIYYFRFKRSKKPSSQDEAQPTETSEPRRGSEDTSKFKDKAELPTDPQATELYVPPKELANNHEVWELDAAGRIGELDTSNAACELHATTLVEIK